MKRYKTVKDFSCRGKEKFRILNRFVWGKDNNETIFIVQEAKTSNFWLIPENYTFKDFINHINHPGNRINVDTILEMLDKN